MRKNSYKTLLKNILESYSNNEEDYFFISIGGCSRTGKSTLSKRLLNDFNKQSISAFIFNLDDWLISIEKRKSLKKVNQRFDYEGITNSIGHLRKREKFSTPIYNPKTRVTKGNNNVVDFDHDICIIEGVVALDIVSIVSLSQIRIYTEIADSLRINRLIDFYLVYKNLPIIKSLQIILDREKEEVPYIKNTKKKSNITFNP